MLLDRLEHCAQDSIIGGALSCAFLEFTPAINTCVNARARGRIVSCAQGLDDGSARSGPHISDRSLLLLMHHVKVLLDQFLDPLAVPIGVNEVAASFSAGQESYRCRPHLRECAAATAVSSHANSTLPIESSVLTAKTFMNALAVSPVPSTTIPLAVSNPSITVASGTSPAPHPPAVQTPAFTAAPASSRTLSTTIPLAVSYIPTPFAPAGISPAPHPPASRHPAFPAALAVSSVPATTIPLAVSNP